MVTAIQPLDNRILTHLQHLGRLSEQCIRFDGLRLYQG